MNQALKPKFNIPAFLKEKEAEPIEPSDEEQHLASLSRSAGWRVLREYIDGLMDGLDKINEGAIGQGANFEEIGKNTVVINLAKGVVRKVINRVDDAREAIEKIKEERKTRK